MGKKRISMIICLVTILSLGNVVTNATSPADEKVDDGVQSEEYLRKRKMK